jgi:hypothetical protein
MEQPYKGRAIIQDNLTDLQIVIPAKKNWFIIIFIGAWLCGWFLGEIFAITMVTRLGVINFGSLFLIVWLIGWTVGGLLALRFFLWILKGKEIITVGQGRLVIDKKGMLLYKPKTYDLNEVKNIRVQEDNHDNGGFLGRRSNNFGTINSGETIKFDYGLKTIKIAGGLDEAEARFIIQKLKDKHLLTERNYS